MMFLIDISIDELFSFGLLAYLGLIWIIILPHIRMFSPQYMRYYGMQHRVLGGAYMTLLSISAWDLVFHLSRSRAFLHISLPVLGTLLARSASKEFKGAHAPDKVRNVASGALDKDQTVTTSEMTEHVFYQGLNVAQALYMHLDQPKSTGGRWLWYIAVCLPWAFRFLYPVNSFSDNYHKEGRDPWAWTSILYRIKKWQYVFYKHALLHGLNISCALEHGGTTAVARSHAFATYWTGLNAAYSLEFFLQSLVKRGILAQKTMLHLNQLLMFICSVPALRVLSQFVRPEAALMSCFLNFVSRGNELLNLQGLLVAMVIFDKYVR